MHGVSPKHTTRNDGWEEANKHCILGWPAVMPESTLSVLVQEPPSKKQSNSNDSNTRALTVIAYSKPEQLPAWL